MKYLVVMAFVVILCALAFAGIAMVRDSGGKGTKAPRMMRALALRVGVSVALFALLMIAYRFGWIAPTGIPLR